MLAIAGGIIIAVLVLAYLDVILTFAILAAMAIGAVLLLVLLYQFSPGLAGLLGIVAFFVIAYITDSDAPKTAPNLAVKPNQQKHWIVQISGAGAVSEIPIEKAPKTEEVMKLWVNGIVWHNLGVCHETLEAAESFARRRNEYYKTKNSVVLIRVVSNFGDVHRIDTISGANDVGLELARFAKWAKRKVVSIFRQ